MLSAGFEADTIVDFILRQDSIQLARVLNFGKLSIVAGNNGTLIRWASNNQLLAVLSENSTNALGLQDFNSVEL